MKHFLNPKSIAIIGASNKEGKVGNSLMLNLKEFIGEVYPVNPKEKQILGIKAYPSVLKITKKIDLAIIAIPALLVKDIVKECMQKGIDSIIIVSAGFSEIGNKKEEQGIINLAKGKARILGPNDFGVVNPSIGLDTSFAKQTPMEGDIAFISQSGALWSAVSDWSIKQGFGFSKFISLGNEADIGFNDCIKYLNEDKETKVIALYIEVLKEGRKFMDIARKSKKPIIAIKAGKTKSGIKAALSHTGSLAGEYEIYKAAFKQSGVILVDSLTQLFDTANLLSKQKIKGKRAVILTNAGGPGALMADYCADADYDVVELPKEFIKKLDLPGSWSHNNPIDIIGDAKADRYKEVLDKIKDENFYDILIVLLTPQGMTEIKETANLLVEFKEQTDKQIIACFMGGLSVEQIKLNLNKNNIPCFTELERLAHVLKIIQK